MALASKFYSANLMHAQAYNHTADKVSAAKQLLEKGFSSRVADTRARAKRRSILEKEMDAKGLSAEEVHCVHGKRQDEGCSFSARRTRDPPPTCSLYVHGHGWALVHRVVLLIDSQAFVVIPHTCPGV